MPKDTIGNKDFSFLRKLILIIFGIFLCLILIELGLRLAGFILLSLQEHRNKVSMQSKNSYRIMCLGESTTVGAGWIDEECAYPNQLKEVLNNSNTRLRFSMTKEGVIGTNTTCILNKLEEQLNKYNPDMVIVMMGINDKGNHIPYEDLEAPKIILFFKSFKTYKLSRLLWLHIVTRAKEIGINKPKGAKIEIPHANIAAINHAEDKVLTVISPHNKDTAYYIDSALECMRYEKYSSAKELLKKAIELDYKNKMAWLALGDYYRGQGQYPQAEWLFDKLTKSPISSIAYSKLMGCYREQRKFVRVEETFKKAIELNSLDCNAYFELTWCYIIQGKYAQAEELRKKATKINPQTYTGFTISDKERNEYLNTIELLKRAIQLNPKDEKVCGLLALLYKQMGQYNLSAEYFKKANEIRLEEYNPETRSNFRKLKHILEKRNIKLVCVQYPLRSVKSLKKIFDEKDNMLFVDNEKVFKEALNKAEYREYFVDAFAGDFGHCTCKGYRLLAENIANTILNYLQIRYKSGEI